MWKHRNGQIQLCGDVEHYVPSLIVDKSESSWDCTMVLMTTPRLCGCNAHMKTLSALFLD